MINWISCKKELPGIGTNVLLLTPRGILQVKRIDRPQIDHFCVIKSLYTPSCFYDLNNNIPEEEAIYWAEINLPIEE